MYTDTLALGVARRRKRIDNVKGPELNRLEKAFRDLKNSVFARPFNYDCWATVHARVCPHSSGLFLPWHRAYLFAFENALRSVGGDVTLPYWDWTVTRQVPDAVKDQSSPLYRCRYDDGCGTRPAGVQLPTTTDVESVMRVPDFNHFGGVGCPGIGQHNGDLEAIHNWVHAWVGPDMTLPSTAARDPIFWFHHANVDRLWDLWQRDHPQAAWCDDAQLDGIVGPWRVRDVESIRGSRLGYEYVEDAVIIASAVVVTTDASVQVNIPAVAQGRSAHLLLENVTIRSDSSKPSTLEFFAHGAQAPLARIGLFGVMSSPTHDGMGEHDHSSGHSHSPTLRVQLSSPIGDWTVPTTVVIKATGASPAVAARGLSIGQLTLVTV